MDGLEVLRLAADIADDAEDRWHRERIHNVLRWAPRIAECAWNPVGGHPQKLWTVRLEPKRRVTAAVLASALHELDRAKCTWHWATIPPSATLVFAMLEFSNGVCLNPTFRVLASNGLLTNVLDDGALGLTAEPFACDLTGTLVSDVRVLPVDVDQLADTLNKCMLDRVWKGL